MTVTHINVTKPQNNPSVEKHAHPPRVVYCAILSTLTRFIKFAFYMYLHSRCRASTLQLSYRATRCCTNVFYQMRISRHIIISFALERSATPRLVRPTPRCLRILTLLYYKTQSYYRTGCTGYNQSPRCISKWLCNIKYKHISSQEKT